MLRIFLNKCPSSFLFKKKSQHILRYLLSYSTFCFSDKILLLVLNTMSNISLYCWIFFPLFLSGKRKGGGEPANVMNMNKIWKSMWQMEWLVGYDNDTITMVIYTHTLDLSIISPWMFIFIYIILKCIWCNSIFYVCLEKGKHYP